MHEQSYKLDLDEVPNDKLGDLVSYLVDQGFGILIQRAAAGAANEEKAHEKRAAKLAALQRGEIPSGAAPPLLVVGDTDLSGYLIEEIGAPRAPAAERIMGELALAMATGKKGVAAARLKEGGLDAFIAWLCEAAANNKAGKSGMSPDALRDRLQKAADEQIAREQSLRAGLFE